MSKNKSAAVDPRVIVQRPLKKRIMDNWQLYAMLAIPVILTIIYKYIENAKYSYSTAVGLFNTVVNIILLIVVNKIAHKISEDTSFI